MTYIIRNDQKFGPYDDQTLVSYVNGGQLLLSDVLYDNANHTTKTVRQYLKSKKLKTQIQHAGGIFLQLQKIGSELIVPTSAFQRKHWITDKRLLLLAIIGLCPSAIGFFVEGGVLVFYLLSLYFATIWGLFFYYFFKTPQVTLKTTLLVFFITQISVFIIWDILGIPNLNPFYNLTGIGLPLSLFGFVFGVGLTEELGKAIPLFIINRTAKEPLIPQTMVYYGLMSGIAFGVFEGVQYQMGINVEYEYDSAYYLNILRLTSLPFIHAVWCGIAGYFIAFANLYPKYRLSLYVLAIAVPMLLHGVYDSFCGNWWGQFISLPIMFVGVVLLSAYLKQGVNYQSRLRN